jgi:predicted nucleotide-binding protein
LGFKKVVILKEEGLAVPSNLAGLQYISFSDNRVTQAFYELGLFLKNAGLTS